MSSKRRTRRAKIMPLNEVKRADDLHNMIEKRKAEDLDFDNLIKQEYQRLLRQYRLREDERNSVIKKGNVLTKQAKLLDLLNKEILDMGTDLYNVESEKNQIIDNNSRQSILYLLESYEKMTVEQALAIKNIHEMSKHVDRVVKFLVEHKLKVQAIYGHSITYAQIEKKRRVLKDRLYFYTTRLCLKKSENKRIRQDDLEVSLKLRSFFHNRYIYLKQQLYKIRIQMGDIVFLATQAYSQQEEIVTSIQFLRERNERDNRLHVHEVKEFRRVLHHDTLSREFNMKKTQLRNVVETLAQRSGRKYRDKLDELNGRLQMYIRTLNFILTESSFSSMEKLIRKYNEIVYKNFAMFRYNCDFNDEIIILRDKTMEMSHSIEVLYQESEQRKLQQQLHIQKVKDKKGVFENDLNNLDIMLTKTEMNLEEVYPILNTLFTTVGCSQDTLGRLLGNFGGIHALNSNLCIRLIESKTHDLCKKLKELESRRDLFENMNHPMSALHRLTMQLDDKIQLTSGGPFLPNVILPSNLEGDMDEDDDEVNSRPIPFGELRSAMLERLHLRQK